MYKILKKEYLNPTVVRMVIEAPNVAKHAKAGQFIILRVHENGERIPLTIADSNAKDGSVTIIFQIVGKTTILLEHLNEGETIHDFVGPLGNPSRVDGFKNVCIIGGGVGCAIAYPTAKAFAKERTQVTSIVGFRNKDLVILEDEFKECSHQYYLMSDDGTVGEKGLVTNKLEELILKGANFDHVVAIGPLMMMKFVCNLTKKYNIPTTVSMNPIMIDGTGMCGGCRLKVGNEIKFACVDGPDFDGHLVDFDEAMSRNTAYREFEQHQREDTCNLYSKEVQK